MCLEKNIYVHTFIHPYSIEHLICIPKFDWDQIALLSTKSRLCDWQIEWTTQESESQGKNDGKKNHTPTVPPSFATRQLQIRSSCTTSNCALLTLRVCLERRNTKQRNRKKHRNRKGIYVHNKGINNTGILKDLVFGTKESEQHRN